ALDDLPAIRDPAHIDESGGCGLAWPDAVCREHRAEIASDVETGAFAERSCEYLDHEIVLRPFPCLGPLKSWLRLRRCRGAPGQVAAKPCPDLTTGQGPFEPPYGAMTQRPPGNPEQRPWWHPDKHADRRPFLMARGRIKAALRGWFEDRGFVEVETSALQ